MKIIIVLSIIMAFFWSGAILAVVHSLWLIAPIWLIGAIYTAAVERRMRFEEHSACNFTFSSCFIGTVVVWPVVLLYYFGNTRWMPMITAPTHRLLRANLLYISNRDEAERREIQEWISENCRKGLFSPIIGPTTVHFYRENECLLFLLSGLGRQVDR